MIALPALLLGVLVFGSVAYGAGELDPTLSGDGKVVTDFGGGDEEVSSVAIQADGKIVAAGLTGPLARYNSDGSLDPSFDGDGRVATDFTVFGVAIQPDGKIVLAGEVGGLNFALARYNPDGSLDPNFDGDGKVVTDFGGDDFANGVAIQADGKIVAAGLSDFNFALARYNPDGSLDPTFDGDGKVVTDFGANDVARSVAIQADGKIVAAGLTGSGAGSFDFALARYTAIGSLDPSFDGDGRVVTDFGSGADRAVDVAIQADGKIVAAGESISGANPFNFALARYNPDGTLDSTFSVDGKVLTDFGASDFGRGVAIQADGKIVAAGSSGAGANPDNFALARYNPNGTLDSTFSGDGKVLTDFGASDAANGLAIQADGRIVAAGQSNAGPNPSNFALARYLTGAARPPVLDHFLYYRIENGTPAFERRTVTIADQFRTSKARVVEPLRLLNPTSVDGSTIGRPAAHLKCYLIEEPAFRERAVTVVNQFGTRTLQVRQPRRLCNPASKRVPPGTPPPIPTGLDHFRCYVVDGSSINRAVSLEDQFGTQKVVVDEPDYLCNPASKDGSPIRHPDAHLVCYELGGIDPFAARRASLRDQFGVQTFDVVRPTKLCVRSRKRA